MLTYVIMAVVLVAVGVLLRGALQGSPSFGVEAAQGALDVADGLPEADRPSAVKAMRGFATRVLGYADTLEDEVAGAASAAEAANGRLEAKNDGDRDKIASLKAKIGGRQSRIGNREMVMRQNDSQVADLRALADALK